MRFVPILAVAAVLAACTPRQTVVAPPPAPPPPPPMVSAEEEARAAVARAHAAWEEGTRMGRQARWGEAVTYYLEATRLQPSNPTYHMMLAGAYLQQGRTQEAADAMQAGVRAEEALATPNHRVLAVDYERLVELLTRLGRLDEARAAQERQRFHRMMRDAARPQ
ncbi:MAG TPA: tetratricopeptide repeat protein [Longimicrobiaceae bacterium]|nr:tetratricopeptide repeat protein [Longimicrobiaceae bacterium]